MIVRYYDEAMQLIGMQLIGDEMPPPIDEGERREIRGHAVCLAVELYAEVDKSFVHQTMHEPDNSVTMVLKIAQSLYDWIVG